MLFQVLILLYILFSFYTLSIWISNFFRRRGINDSLINEIFVPLIFSIFSFFILTSYGSSAFLMFLIPLMFFSRGKYSFLILPSLLLLFISPYLPLIIFPFLIYFSMVENKKKFSYTKSTLISISLPIIAIISIAFGSYLMYLFPFSLISFLLVAMFIPFSDIISEKINISRFVLYSITFFIPIVATFKKVIFNRDLLLLSILFSLVPFFYSLIVDSRSQNKS